MRLAKEIRHHERRLLFFRQTLECIVQSSTLNVILDAQLMSGKRLCAYTSCQLCKTRDRTALRDRLIANASDEKVSQRSPLGVIGDTFGPNTDERVVDAVLRVVGVLQDVIGDGVEQGVVPRIGAIESDRLPARESIFEGSVRAYVT